VSFIWQLTASITCNKEANCPACSLDKIRIHTEELILNSIQACDLVEEGPNSGKRHQKLMSKIF
jgi:hypothetical protein